MDPEERFVLRQGLLVGGVALALLTAALLLSCNPLPRSRNSGDYDNPVAALEYEASGRLSVFCVFPGLSPDSQPLDLMYANLVGSPARFSGSTVAVGPQYALTARHVVDCDLDLPSGRVLDGELLSSFLQTRHGETHEMVVENWGRSRAEDVALLIATDGAKPFKVWALAASREPAIDGVVCVAAAAPRPSRRCGKITEFRHGLNWMEGGYFVYDANTTPGNSGSGVYNEAGYLVAIHVAGVGVNSPLGGGYGVSRWRWIIPEIYADPLDW